MLHDAIRGAAFTAREGPGDDGIRFAGALGVVEQLLSRGADPNCVDSYGNTALMRALLDARQRVVTDPGFPRRIENAALRADLGKLFAVLIHSGADPALATPAREAPHASTEREPALKALLAELHTVPNS